VCKEAIAVFGAVKVANCGVLALILCIQCVQI
jgi:hypothetical protein